MVTCCIVYLILILNHQSIVSLVCKFQRHNIIVSLITITSESDFFFVCVCANLGWIGCENRVLDDGGHGKWAVPLAHPCCTTSKI
jgi:hypothetical protein